jgi:hypothetical protein
MEFRKISLKEFAKKTGDETRGDEKFLHEQTEITERGRGGLLVPFIFYCPLSKFGPESSTPIQNCGHPLSLCPPLPPVKKSASPLNPQPTFWPSSVLSVASCRKIGALHVALSSSLCPLLPPVKKSVLPISPVTSCKNLVPLLKIALHRNLLLLLNSEPCTHCTQKLLD